MAIPLPYDPYEVKMEDEHEQHDDDDRNNNNHKYDHIALTYAVLDEMHEINIARHASAGAICSFIGTTRDNFQGKTVTELEYEAYPSMALKTMKAIVREARSLALQGDFSFEWPYAAGRAMTTSASSTITQPPAPHLIPQTHSNSSSSSSSVKELTRICLVHRLGIVPPKESSIAIVVSSPHRKEAFRACEWILEQVKRRVEIWKREVYAPVEDVDAGAALITTPVDASPSRVQVQKAWKENFPPS